VTLRALRHGLVRLAVIFRVLARHALAHQAARRLAPGSRALRFVPLARVEGPVRLRMLFEELGGTFIKFGQMLALQPDLLPLEYCDALFKLLDRVDPFPYGEVERIVREELGRGPDEVFEAFERAPLATASVGQVHVARLGGRKVVVKVQRPDVEIEFANDVRLMAAAVRLIAALRIGPLLWLVQPMSEFISWSREELDYRYEAAYGAELRRHAGDNPVQYVPEVHLELTTRRVLVVEFLDGVTLLDFLRARPQAGGPGDPAVLARLAAMGFEPQRFAENVVGNFLGDAFRHGVYHADLHPANLIILPGNVVGYVDFGITGLMSRYSRRHLMAMSLALAEGDVDGLCREYLKITVQGPETDVDAFRRGVEELAASWYRGDGAGGRRLAASITKIFDDVLALSRRAGVLPERDIVKYIRSTVAIDGLLGRFAPGFDLTRHLARVCSGFLRWQGRLDWVAPERVLEQSRAAGSLFADGPARAARALERLAARPRRAPARPPARPRPRGGDPGPRRRAAVSAAALAGTAALLAFAPSSSPFPAPGLRSAELLVLAASAGSLLLSLRRLGAGRA
jgi:ubiquinone biosynthesis protein